MAVFIFAFTTSPKRPLLQLVKKALPVYKTSYLLVMSMKLLLSQI